MVQSKKIDVQNGNLLQARRLARQRALQALYQRELNPIPIKSMIEQFMQSQDMSKTDTEYFQELLSETSQRVEELDAKLEPYLDIPDDQLDPIERNILRLAAFELTQRMEIPYRVIISEAVSLAKKFGAEDGHKFVNGVLDKAVKEWRPFETK